MIHFIYALIIRLHPKQFRERFGSEMTATFEQAVVDGWGLRLVVDGLVSLTRQWLKVADGSARTHHALVPDRPAYLEALRQQSIETLGRIWRLNAAWSIVLLAAYAIGANWPVTFYRTPWIIVPVALCILLILRTAPGLMDGPLQSMKAVSLKEDPRIAQLQIEGERIVAWSSHFVAMLSVMAGMQNATRLLTGFESLDMGDRVVRLSVAAVLLFGVVIVPHYLRKLNGAAVQVLQNEIDAIRDVQSKGVLEDRF